MFPVKQDAEIWWYNEKYDTVNKCVAYLTVVEHILIDLLWQAEINWSKTI